MACDVRAIARVRVTQFITCARFARARDSMKSSIARESQISWNAELRNSKNISNIAVAILLIFQEIPELYIMFSMF